MISGDAAKSVSPLTNCFTHSVANLWWHIKDHITPQARCYTEMWNVQKLFYSRAPIFSRHLVARECYAYLYTLNTMSEIFWWFLSVICRNCTATTTTTTTTTFIIYVNKQRTHANYSKVSTGLCRCMILVPIRRFSDLTVNCERNFNTCKKSWVYLNVIYETIIIYLVCSKAEKSA